ncbi:response regulator [Paenibacillus elgii]|uniref:response regulator n=1 Tax=Paenibacillus elgii TaxID=189691 RepID=UPI0013D15C46|nr:response regulator [Paenibacillus elgii]NEN84958.1 response regulator [Paenibacillus elgii]
MLRTILIDDEKPSLNWLSRIIEERKELEIVGSFTKVSELLESFADLRPELVFLDIEMPGVHGIELASRLTELDEDIEIVFVTAYQQYALEAFRVNATDYLLKPVQPEDLQRTVERLMKRKRPAVRKPESGSPGIRCFGQFGVYTALNPAEPIRFPTAKTEELLAFFLVHAGVNISKWTLCESLWPGFTPEKAEQNLHTTVFRLKKTLKHYDMPVTIHSQRGVYRFETDMRCDYLEFDRQLKPYSMGDMPPEQMKTIIPLFQGPLFGGKDYPWCEAEKERVYSAAVDLSKRLTSHYLSLGEADKSTELLKHMIAVGPFHEDVHVLLLSAFLHLKDRTAFITHYDKFANLLRAELDIEPGPAAKELYRQMFLGSSI